jgi:hypothetical protein
VYKVRTKEEIRDQELVQEQVQEAWDQVDLEVDQDQEQVLEEEEFKIKEIFPIINKAFQEQ